MDAYWHGLDEKQAAWASKKFKGHCVLPESLMEDLDNAGWLVLFDTVCLVPWTVQLPPQHKLSI
jgi:hypothetical protein